MNRGFSYREQVGPAEAGRAVLHHLATAYPHTTALGWAARVANGEVELDARVARGDEVLRPGQQLVWHRPPWAEPPAPLHFDVLHDDADVLAVAKPSGLPTMPAGGYLDHTLLALVQARYPGARPLHRLGRFTSGVVLFARTHDAAATLARAWRSQNITKIYRALGTGVPTWDVREVTAAIGPVPHPVLGTVHGASVDGKASRSTLTVVARRAATTVFEVSIATGRPHQIRIHLAFAGHPLENDPLYAPGGLPHAVTPGLPGDGGYWLHAHRVRSAHPNGRDELVVEAPLPEILRVDHGAR